MRRYSEDQPREANGEWGSSGDGPRSGVVYHGTGAEHSLDPSHTATATGNPTAVWGTFFTPSEREAERYVHDFHEGKGVVMSARVSLTDPYHMSFGENERFQKLDLGRPLEGQMKELTEKAREFKVGLMKEGYDGIIIGKPGVSRPMEIVAFSSGQIEHQGTRAVDKLKGDVRRYSEDQPRDDHGRFGSGGGGWDTSEKGYPRTDYTPPDTSGHKLFRDGGYWGGSHFDSFKTTGRAATLMGIPGYKDESHEEHISKYSAYSESDIRILGKVDKELTTRAEKLIAAIGSDEKGSEEHLYHGYEDRTGAGFKVGDTMRLPPLATSGSLLDSQGYGTHLDKEYQVGTPTVLAFDKGTQMAAYQRWGKEDQKDFGHVYSEAIVAGGYRVTHVEMHEANNSHDERPVRVVFLQQTESYNPKKGGWNPR